MSNTSKSVQIVVPKRGRTAYIMWSSENRKQVKDAHPNADFKEISKLLGAGWQKLDAKTKQKYTNRAAKEKVEADARIAQFKEEHPDVPLKKTKKNGGKRGGKGAKPKPAVKRARSAYIFYMMETRSEVVKRNPDLNFGEVGALIGKMWNELPEKKKVKFQKLAEADKVRAQKEREALKETEGETKEVKPKPKKKSEPKPKTTQTKEKSKKNEAKPKSEPKPKAKVEPKLDDSEYSTSEPSEVAESSDDFEEMEKVEFEESEEEEKVELEASDEESEPEPVMKPTKGRKKNIGEKKPKAPRKPKKKE